MFTGSDIAPPRTSQSLERFTVGEAVKTAELSTPEAVRDILQQPVEAGEVDRLSRRGVLVAGASTDDVRMLREALLPGIGISADTAPSPTTSCSAKWDDYTSAKETKFFHADTADATRTVTKSDRKKRARLNAMRCVLHRLPHGSKDTALIGAMDPLIVGRAHVVFDRGEKNATALH